MTNLEIVFAVMFVVGVIVAASGFAGLALSPKAAVAIPVLIVLVGGFMVAVSAICVHFGWLP